MPENIPIWTIIQISTSASSYTLTTNCEALLERPCLLKVLYKFIYYYYYLSQPLMASTVRVKRPPSIRNKRRTRRRIYNEEMGHGEASAGCGQDKQAAEDVREVPGGCGEDKQDSGGVRQAPAGCRQRRLGYQPPQGFLRQVGARHNQPIVHLWQWNRIYAGDPFRPRNVKFTGEERILVLLPRNPTAQDFFKLYINDQIIDHIVVQTNLYAKQFIEQH